MSTYPQSPRAAFLTWCNAHTTIFTDNAASIGLSPGAAAAFAAALDAANASVTSQAVAKDAAKVATNELATNMETLSTLAANIVRTIRAFAESTNNPAVYDIAAIPAPAAPTDVPPPALCTDLTATLDGATGNITLKWKATQPEGANGTSYIITRRAAGQANFSFLGVSGKKSFVDSTFTAGPDSVQYQVQGTRSDSTGPMSAILTVSFGRTGAGGGGGFTIASQSVGENGKLAA
jgi:hypothetical protein